MRSRIIPRNSSSRKNYIRRKYSIFSGRYHHYRKRRFNNKKYSFHFYKKNRGNDKKTRNDEIIRYCSCL